MTMFKRLTWLLFVALFILVGSAASVSASIVESADKNFMWTKADHNSATVLTFNGIPEDFYMVNEAGGSWELFDKDDGFGFGVIELTFGKKDGSDDWWAINTSDFVLNLGSSIAFGFYFESPEYKYEFEKNTETTFFLYDGVMEVILTDVAPLHAPVPATILLFGSGLLGLVGMKRRKD